MNAYKNLDKYEKLEYIRSSGVSGKSDRHEIAVYLNALRQNKVECVEEFEKFGDDPFKMSYNKRCFERQLLFGFSEFTIDKHGWVNIPDLINIETIGFKIKNESSYRNSIDVGRGLNGKWSFGICYCTGNSGGSGSASIFGTIVSSRKEAIVSALNKLIDVHNRQRERLHKKDTCGNYNEAYSLSILKQVQEYLDEYLGKKPVQYQLF